MAKVKDTAEGVTAVGAPQPDLVAQLIEKLDRLERENQEMRLRLESVVEQQDRQPVLRANLIAKQAQEILARARKLRLRVDKDGKPIPVEAVTSYEPHVEVDRKPPNYAVWTKIVNPHDRKRLGQFRKKPVVFYSDNTDEQYVIADYERMFNTKFNPKLQELRKHKV